MGCEGWLVRLLLDLGAGPTALTIACVSSESLLPSRAEDRVRHRDQRGREIGDRKIGLDPPTHRLYDTDVAMESA